MPPTIPKPTSKNSLQMVYVVSQAGSPGAERFLVKDLASLLELYRAPSYLQGRIDYFRAHVYVLGLFADLSTALKNIERGSQAVFTVCLPKEYVQHVPGVSSEVTCSREAFDKCTPSDIYAINFRKGLAFCEAVCIQLDRSREPGSTLSM